MVTLGNELLISQNIIVLFSIETSILYTLSLAKYIFLVVNE